MQPIHSPRYSGPTQGASPRGTHLFILAEVLAENSKVGQLLGYIRMVHSQELHMTSHDIT